MPLGAEDVVSSGLLEEVLAVMRSQVELLSSYAAKVDEVASSVKRIEADISLIRSAQVQSSLAVSALRNEIFPSKESRRSPSAELRAIRSVTKDPDLK